MNLRDSKARANSTARASRRIGTEKARSELAILERPFSGYPGLGRTNHRVTCATSRTVGLCHGALQLPHSTTAVRHGTMALYFQLGSFFFEVVHKLIREAGRLMRDHRQASPSKFRCSANCSIILVVIGWYLSPWREPPFVAPHYMLQQTFSELACV